MGKCMYVSTVSALVCVAGVGLGGGCGKLGGPNPHAAGYAVELLQCVNKADSSAAADECRDAVRKKYGRVDAGSDARVGAALNVTPTLGDQKVYPAKAYACDSATGVCKQ